MSDANACQLSIYRVQPEECNEQKDKAKHPGVLKNISCYTAEFCQNTSLHGLKFLGERGRGIVEKLWWLIILAVSLYFCSDLMFQTYRKWQKSPIIVNFATTQTPIWQIPFPAITICPETKTLRNKFNYTDIHLKRIKDKLTPTEEEHYEYMTLLCMSKQNVSYQFVDEKMLDFITEVAPKLEDVLWYCKWMGSYEPCENLFVPVVTDVGVCYSFNILDRSEIFKEDVYQYGYFQMTNKSEGWSPEDGYSDNDESDSYPNRALFSGAKAGLSLNLILKRVNKDYICAAGMQGYKVHLHHPADMPRVDENYFRVSLDEAVIVTVKPSVMSTNEKLYTYPYQKRQCYFPGERPLRFFKMYSQQNCYVECLANFTLKACNCVPFHMPRIHSTAICGPTKMTCAALSETMLLSEEVDRNIKNFANTAIRNKSYETCDCLPSCTSTNYEAEISQTYWNWAKYYNSIFAEFTDYIAEPKHNSKLIVFFRDKQIMTSERNELYGPTDFIANCGGLLGLFIGFSVISLMELVYFLTLRLAFNIRKFGRHFWSGNQKLLKQRQPV